MDRRQSTLSVTSDGWRFYWRMANPHFWYFLSFHWDDSPYISNLKAFSKENLLLDSIDKITYSNSAKFLMEMWGDMLHLHFIDIVDIINDTAGSLETNLPASGRSGLVRVLAHGLPWSSSDDFVRWVSSKLIHQQMTGYLKVTSDTKSSV